MDLTKIGAYISSLRKGKDLTQMELADMLNVSHQAVSKWERGESLPDIMTLPKLAQIFRKSIDEILSCGNILENTRHSKDIIITELAQNNAEEVAEMINQGKADVESVVNIAPILKPSMVNKVAENLNGITIEHLSALAPFIDKEAMDKLAGHLLNSSIDIKYVAELAPFLGKDTIEKLVGNIETQNLNPDTLVYLAPFMSSDTIDRLVGNVMKGTLNTGHIRSLSPFIKRETLDRLVSGVESGKLSEKLLEDIAPFVGKETLNRLVDEFLEGSNKISLQAIESLAPFLGKDNIGRLIEGVDKGKLSGDVLSHLAPFIGRETLGRIIDRIIADNTK